MQNNNSDFLLGLYEREYTLFLSKQGEYEYTARMLEDRLVLDMEKSSSMSNLPTTIKCVFFLTGGRPSVVINDTTFDYTEGILEQYILNCIKDNIMKDYFPEKNENIEKAADMLGLTPGDILEKKLINTRYKTAVKELHPDRWVQEDDPVLSKNAADAVIQMTEARDILLENIERNRA